MINALRPFIPVTTVGETTYGKPVGQYGITFCDKVLYPVAFTLRNALGQGDYFNGIAADCAAADDPDHQFGDPPEASLAEALTVVRTGQLLRVARECRAGATARDDEGGPAAAEDGTRAIDRRALNAQVA